MCVRYRHRRRTGHALGEPVVEGALRRVGGSRITVLEIFNSVFNQTEHTENLGEVVSSRFYIHSCK
jgi:hypothetical protein